MTHCTVSTVAGEKFEGFVKHYKPRSPGFYAKNLKLYNGRKPKKIFSNHIQSITITSDSTVYKARVNGENKRSFMKVMQENDDFYVYMDLVTRSSSMNGYGIWTDYHYYFIHDGTSYQLPYNELRMRPSTFFESVDELISAMQKAARDKNVALPDFLDNYNK